MRIEETNQRRGAGLARGKMICWGIANRTHIEDDGAAEDQRGGGFGETPMKKIRKSDLSWTLGLSLTLKKDLVPCWLFDQALANVFMWFKYFYRRSYGLPIFFPCKKIPLGKLSHLFRRFWERDPFLKHDPCECDSNALIRADQSRSSRYCNTKPHWRISTSTESSCVSLYPPDVNILHMNYQSGWTTECKSQGNVLA